MAGKWDFYLYDGGSHKYVYCALKNYHLEKDGISNAFGYTGPCIRFIYEVSPVKSKREPKDALLISMTDFHENLFINDYLPLNICEYDVLITCKKSGTKIKINCFTDIDELIDELGTDGGELEMIYYSTISIMNPMAHLIYMIQLRDKLAETVFLKDTNMYGTLCRLEYRNWTNRLEFYVEDLDYVVPYDDETLESVVEGAYDWFSFGFFDLIRAIARPIPYDVIFDYLGKFDVKVEHLSGVTRIYTISDEEDYTDLMDDLCDEKAKIKAAYFDRISSRELNDFILYRYGENRHLFEMHIPKDVFLNEYKAIPAIAHNDTIQEV